MLFNSYPFLFAFLPLTLVVFYVGHAFSRTLALATLLCASLAFYAYWNPAYLPLLLGTISLTYLTSLAMHRYHDAASTLMWGGIMLLLGLLGYYKYAGFLYDNTLGLNDGAQNPFTGIILPLGISFFTFQQIAYLVDIRKERFPVPAPQTFALSITFFPHLIAGPIILFRNMRNQIESRRALQRADLIRIQSGAILFSIGLFKKAVIADSIAPFVQTIFSYAARDGVNIGTVDAWVGTLGYTLQLYFDFSGYSDMAVGLARMFGFRIPFNFNAPYKASSPIEFWRRWHISLMYFFREYLYIPLGGNRKGMPRQIGNITIVFFLTGLWHGAGWTYILWGTLHGILVVLNHLWRRLAFSQHTIWKNKIFSVVKWGCTMYAVMALWILFRAPDMTTAARILEGFTFANSYSSSCLHPSYGSICGAWLLLPLSLLGIMTAIGPNSLEITAWLQKKRATILSAAFCGGLLYLAISSIAKVKSEFLYFQF